MWLKYEGIEIKRGLTAKSGKKYDAWVLKGQRKGFDGAPDTPYEKTFFDNTTTTVVEKGVNRPGIGIVSFFRNGCDVGDTIIMTYSKTGPRRNLDVETIRNLTKDGQSSSAIEYTPLDERDAEDVNFVRANQNAVGSEETPPWV